MTIEEYNKRKRDKTDPNAYVITVLKHKMAHKGPVDVAVSSSFMPYLKTYVSDIRGRLDGISSKKDDLVFTTFQGTEMSPSLLGMFTPYRLIPYMYKNYRPKLAFLVISDKGRAISTLLH